jgi:thiol-disulfide isomerase/thioredoxin
MTTKLIRFSSLFTALFLLTAAVRAQTPAQSQAQEVAAVTTLKFVPVSDRGKPVKLVLSDIKGSKRQVSEFKGKVVVVNFWATWCVPCKGEMPEFTKAYAAYRDRGVEFLGAANEPRSSRPKVEVFMREYAMQFPVWLEVGDQVLTDFGVGPGIPDTVILDQQGRIAARIVGATDGAHLRELLDRVIKE